jgi:hypothetical protein
MGRRDKARFHAGRSINSGASQNQCPSNFGKLRLTEKDCSIVHTSCSVAFKALGSLSASRPKQLSPLELDNDDGIDVDLEYLDDVSLFGCNNDDVWDQSGNEFTSDKADHGNTGSDDDNTGSDDDLDDPRRRTAGEHQPGQTFTTKRCEKRQLEVVTPRSLLTSHLGKPSLSEEVGAKHLLYEFELEDSDGYEDDENEFQDEEENKFLDANQIEFGSNPVGSTSSLCK